MAERRITMRGMALGTLVAVVTSLACSSAAAGSPSPQGRLCAPVTASAVSGVMHRKLPFQDSLSAYSARYAGIPGASNAARAIFCTYGTSGDGDMPQLLAVVTHRRVPTTVHAVEQTYDASDPTFHVYHGLGMTAVYGSQEQQNGTLPARKIAIMVAATGRTWFEAVSYHGTTPTQLVSLIKLSLKLHP